MLTPEELRAQANRYRWYHHVPLGQGVVTSGMIGFSWEASHFPSFKDRTVLDIGAWDGGYSFLAEREGARRVVALDHYAWGVDMQARDKYWEECAARGVLPDHQRDVTDFWDESLPGRQPFDFARKVLNSRVEPMVADFTTVDLNSLGLFDVVLYLGVLYHMKEPLTCLERVRKVTGEVAAIATVALNVPGMNDQRLLQFHPGNELEADYGNWFVPSPSALEAMCLAAGFSSVDVIVGPPIPALAVEPGVAPLRRILHRLVAPPAPAKPPAVPPVGRYLAMVHAHVN